MISLLSVTRENFPGFQSDLLSIERQSFSSPWDVNSFSSEIDREISHFWVATVDDVLCGYICFWIFAQEVHLLNIAVRETCRRKGLGRQLLTQMLEVGIGEKAETAWLEVRPGNVAARALYRRIGFAEVGLRPAYYTDSREDAILMSMPIHKHGTLKGSNGKTPECS